jgi:hypothetical protein
MQVFLALMDVRETVDGVAGKMALGLCKVLEPGFLGEIVGRPDGVDGVHLQLITPVDKMAVIIYVAAHLAQAVDELFLGSQD